MKTRKISISTQLFLFILGASLVVALIVGGVSYSTMGRFLRQKTMDDVMEIAVIAAENVDGEIFLKAMEGDQDALSMVKDSLSFFCQEIRSLMSIPSCQKTKAIFSLW